MIISFRSYDLHFFKNFVIIIIESEKRTKGLRKEEGMSMCDIINKDAEYYAVVYKGETHLFAGVGDPLDFVRDAIEEKVSEWVPKDLDEDEREYRIGCYKQSIIYDIKDKVMVREESYFDEDLQLLVCKVDNVGDGQIKKKVENYAHLNVTKDGRLDWYDI